MRTLLIPLLFLVAACRNEEEPKQFPVDGPAPKQVEVFAGSGRDRLCVRTPATSGEGTEQQQQTAGLITFADAGDENCSMRGEVTSKAAFRMISPSGDSNCTVRLEDNGASITLQSNDQCAYYCGPDVKLDGKTFTRMEKAEPVTDIAGDPLC